MKQKMQMWKIVAAGVVLCMVSSRALAVSDDEFVGPFTNWINIKTAYGAVGNGTNDDTVAFQNALNDLGTTGHGHILWVPAGTYKITSQITLYSRLGVSIIGEDPATTVIQWRGTNTSFDSYTTSNAMLVLDSVAYSRFNRLTFDGGGDKVVLIDQSWDQHSNYFDTGNEYADDNFQNAYIGIRGGVLGGGFAEVSVWRDHFTNLQTAGLITMNFNALDLWVHESVFDHVGVGVGNWATNPDGSGINGAGDFRVYNCIFRYSSVGDIAFGNTAPFSIRNNYSIGANMFINSGSGTANPANTVIQGNTILDTIQRIAICTGDQGPVLMYDNVIRSTTNGSGQAVVLWQWNGDVDAVAVSNTFTVANPIYVSGYLDEIDTVVVSTNSIHPSEPVLPGTQTNYHRQVFEVPTGASAATIQQIITNAVAQYNGQRPVVHFADGNYNIGTTIVIPSNSDVQLVGDGEFYTQLNWGGGAGGGPVVQIQGPSHATLRELAINGSQQVDTLVANNIDQPGARFYMLGSYSSGGKYACTFYDGLDYAALDILDGGGAGSDMRGGADLRVIGGPLAAAGNPQGGKVAIYSGGGGDEYYTSNVDVSRGGTLLMRDNWFDGEPSNPYSPYAYITRGTVTFEGDHIWMNGQDYPQTPPTFDLTNFVGKASILGMDMGNAVVISGDGSNAQVAGIGIFRDQPAPVSGTFFYNNASPLATAGLLESRAWTTVAGTATTVVPDQGTTNSTFVKTMLAQARAEQTPSLTNLPNNVTDIRLFRVYVSMGLNSLLLCPGSYTNLPFITSAASTNGLVGAPFSYTITAMHAPTNFNIYPLPAGLSVNAANGVVSGTPAPAAAGTKTVTISAANTSGVEVALLTLTINEMPVILTQPVNATVIENQTTTFSVTAAGFPVPLSYQWLKNGTAIAGATSASYTTPPEVLGDNAALIRVVVSNAFGNVTSSNATLTVNVDTTPPTLVQAWSAGDSNSVWVMFSKAVQAGTGAGGAENPANYALNYGVSVTGAVLQADMQTVKLLTTPPLVTGRIYILTVNNVKDRSATPNTIAPGSQITFQYFTVPMDMAAWWKLDDASGSTATDSTGNGHDGTLQNTVSWTNGIFNGAAYFPGANDEILVSPAMTLATNWTICAWFSAPLPATASWHTLVRAQNADHLIITDSGLDLGMYDNQTGSEFRGCVPAYNLGVLTSGWHHMTAVGSGTTTVFYVDGAYVGTSDHKGGPDVYALGNYPGGNQRFTDKLDDIRIYNRALNTTEIASLAAMGANVAPVIAAQPTNATVTSGQSATFSVTAIGTAPFWYQWRTNAVNIASATNASYNTPATTLADNGKQFSVIVSNAFGSVTSSNATLTVNNASSSATASATGGYTVTNYVENSTNFTAYIFTNNGNFTISGGALTCDLLVVGGGGGGATGGGGAGGYVFSNQMLVTAGTYTVTIGAGGGGTYYNAYVAGTNGTNSAFGNVVAYGGGGGAVLNGGTAGNAGASGGGAGASGTAGRYGGTNLWGTAQGYPGGGQNFGGTDGAPAGGGGGAGARGADATIGHAGNGGVGITNTMSGVAVGYAGGGGGMCWSGGTNISGSASCGGSAGSNSKASPGTANTGGGGGGGNTGGAGGSGIVTVRFSGANNLLFFKSGKNAGGGWGMDFMTANGVSYEMMWRTNLLGGSWMIYTNLMGDGNDAHVVFTNAVPQAFFQIQVTP